MKIAIASSGLGTINRGIETWALDTSNALYRHGVDVTLFAARRVASDAPLIEIPCLRRGTLANRMTVSGMPAFTWRYGLKSDYAVEQTTFWWCGLRRHIKKESFDILHVQDPILADQCRHFQSKDATRTKVILAHGTEETPEFLARFDYLQHLAPWHMQKTLEALHPDPVPSPPSHPFWTAIPNFIDTDVFRPAHDQEERLRLRREIGLPLEGCVIGTAAAIKRSHKRIDALIQEFTQAVALRPKQPLYLVIAGASHPDTPSLKTWAQQNCPGKIFFFENYPHEHMPALLRTLDVFVLASWFEMMPIALLEAISCGIPAIVNRHPVLTWMTGEGGIHVDLKKEGELTRTLLTLEPEEYQSLGEKAHRHAMQHFSERSVIPQYIDYYKQLLSSEKTQGRMDQGSGKTTAG